MNYQFIRLDFISVLVRHQIARNNSQRTLSGRQLRWPGDSQRESPRFTRNSIDSRESIRRKTSIFIMCERFSRIASNLRFAIFSPPGSAIRTKGVQFVNPKTIRENQAIRANLRTDPRGSGRLRSAVLAATMAKHGSPGPSDKCWF